MISYPAYHLKIEKIPLRNLHAEHLFLNPSLRSVQREHTHLSVTKAMFLKIDVAYITHEKVT